MTHGWGTFLDAQTCPWTQGLHTSSLSSTPGTSWFQIGVVLLPDLLPTKAAERSLPMDALLFRRSRLWTGQKESIFRRCETLRPMYVARTHRPPGHATIYRKFNLYVVLPVACEYFSTYRTRSHVVHVVGFWGGPKFEANVHRLNPSAKEEYKPWK